MSQKKLRTEVIQLEDALGQVRKAYEMLRIEFEQTLAAHEQTGRCSILYIPGSCFSLCILDLNICLSYPPQKSSSVVVLLSLCVSSFICSVCFDFICFSGVVE